MALFLVRKNDPEKDTVVAAVGDTHQFGPLEDKDKYFEENGTYDGWPDDYVIVISGDMTTTEAQEWNQYESRRINPQPSDPTNPGDELHELIYEHNSELYWEELVETQEDVDNLQNRNKIAKDKDKTKNKLKKKKDKDEEKKVK